MDLLRAVSYSEKELMALCTAPSRYAFNGLFGQQRSYFVLPCCPACTHGGNLLIIHIHSTWIKGP